MDLAGWDFNMSLVQVDLLFFPPSLYDFSMYGFILQLSIFHVETFQSIINSSFPYEELE